MERKNLIYRVIQDVQNRTGNWMCSDLSNEFCDGRNDAS